ncbi:MAG: alpha-amylase, partial [Stackebrandtia sp.]
SGPSLGFGPAAGWLPQPSDWDGLSVAAQDGDEESTLELYRTALRLRGQYRPQSLTWQETGFDDVLGFDNGALRCVTNFGDTAVTLTGEVMASSAPIVGGQLPGNTTAWLKR